MENYRLEQTGQEVQDILNGAAMQQDLTAEVERAEGAEQTLQGNIDEEERRAKAAEETLSGAIGDEELRAKAAEEALGDAIDGINAKIPAAASSENKLADQDFVNSSIETATATFRGTYNLVSDLHLAVDATHAQIATLLGTVITEADNNDYSYVLVPTSAQTPTEIASIEKYTFGANGWAFAYALNNSGFTSAQWAAINSGITSGLVAKLNALPTNTDLLALLAGKQDVLTFDDVPVEGSNNPVKSGGVHLAIDDEKTARVNAMNQLSGRVDTIEGEIPAQASSENQLADKAYVNSSISTNTATYRGSFNLVADLGLSVSATHEQIGTALAGEIATADNNDYAYVQVPTSDETPSQILKVERYKYNGTAWAFEYELNNSGFTSAQWAALNSGITSGLVGKLNALPTNDELTLALAGKQDVLTFDNTPTENSNNPIKSGGVYAADKALSDAIEAILLLIPSAATSLNKLVDTDLMNSSISTATATFRGTFNLVSDLSLDLTATHAQIATALAGAIATADNNDYAFVQVPTAVGTPTEIAQTDRYKFNGTAWAYEYTLNTSGFTSAQWAAINSGITAALVASLADIPDLIPSEATSANQLADKAYVLAQILAATPAFKGQFTTLAELQAVASPKAGDLGIVRTKDSDGMDVFTVYQYLNNAWGVFYSLSYHPQTKPATTGTTGDYPYNGMGRVELAKNMVNTGTELAPVYENQLTQDMFYKGAVGSRVPNTNTIFVIRYDYVLAENITIPDGCVLEFDGGSLSGYKITGDYVIVAPSVQIFDDVDVSEYKYDFKMAWVVGNRTALTQTDFNKLPSTDIDFENVSHTTSTTITLHHLKNVTLRNFDVSIGGSLQKYLIAPSEYNSGNCSRGVDSLQNMYIQTSVNLPQSYVGYLICIRTADSVKVDPRIESTDIRKGICSIITKIDGDKVYIQDYIESFSASVDRDGTTIYSTFNVYPPYECNFINCNFLITDYNSSVSITAVNSVINNCKFNTTQGAQAVFLLAGYNTKVSKCIINNAIVSTASETNYGIQINGSSNITIEDCDFNDNRRAVDFSGNFETRYCEVRNCRISNRFKQESGSALGGHSSSYGNVFRNNTIFGAYQVGIQCRGEKERIIGNIFYCTVMAAHILSCVDTEIIGNIVVNGNTTFVSCPNIGVASVITIKDNLFTSYGPFVYNTDYANTTLNIIGNNIKFIGTPNLISNKSFKGVFMDNNVEGAGSSFLYDDASSTIALYETLLQGVRVPIALVGYSGALPSTEEAKINYNYRFMYFDMDSKQDYGTGMFNGTIKFVMSFTLSDDLTVPVKIDLQNQGFEYRWGYKQLGVSYPIKFVKKPADTGDLIFSSGYLGLGTYGGLLKAGEYYLEVEL